MKLKTINNQTMQRSNYSYVFRTIYKVGSISRKEIADLTGLKPPTVTNIVAKLLEKGYIVENVEDDVTALGRKPIMLSINKEKAYIIGVELSVSKIICILTDFSGQVLHIVRSKPEKLTDVEYTINQVCGLILDMLGQSGVPRERILGIGFMSAGPFDKEEGIMLNPNNFRGWHNVPVKALVSERLSIPVYFNRDAVACAVAELNSENSRMCENLFAVLINIVGIGGGIIFNGEVYYGMKNYASEMGHMVVQFDGSYCSCGDRGCLETVSSGAAIVNNVKAQIVMGEPSILQDKCDTLAIEDVIGGFRAGDELCVKAVRKAAWYMGMAIGNIVTVISPECITVGGDMIEMFPEYFDLICDVIEERCYINALDKLKIFKFSYGDLQCAVGGVRNVIEEFFSKLTV